MAFSCGWTSMQNIYKGREVINMGRNISKEELISHKEEALAKLSSYMDSLIESEDPKLLGKSDKLSFWLKDWTSFLDFETKFSPSSLRKYKRGEIIKAHLGFNVGSEEGGLHYCVVMDKCNSKNSPIVTVVPLTSVKKTTNLNNLHPGSVYLGNELFRSLSSKIDSVYTKTCTRLKELKEQIGNLSSSTPNERIPIPVLPEEVAKLESNVDLLERLKIEISNMERGSIALVGQIRTISKIRIYNPKTNSDTLSKVKLSNEKLDLLDEEILHNFTNKIQ